jgi:tetratricopeptide (TPR) repeat protein
VQILAVGGRVAELNEPVGRLLALTPATERAAVIASLPRFLERNSDARAVATLLTQVLKPYADAPETRVASRVAIARAWLAAKDPDIALALVRDVQKLEPDAPGAAVLALELMSERPAAEDIVKDYLARPKAAAGLRLAYVRVLTGSQRYVEAARELEIVTRQQPDEPGPFLTLGVLQAELKQPAQAEAALLRYVELAQTAQAAQAAAPATAASAPPLPGDEDDEAGGATPTERGLYQAWLSLAQLAEQRGDFKAAESFLAKVDDPARALDVQSRRATMLARQGQVAQAREMIRRVPERSTEDARNKFLAEAAVLREVKRWKDAFEVLANANQRFPDDPDLLYEQAMMAEKTDRLDEMEKLLRRVIAIRPENPHAHNALGYSLADRGLRLTEARDLIARALELAPGDPFITDSLGWVEFKLGRPEVALKLLRQAYSARPDPEIGAHLGEVLWSMGQKDEARKIWREARARDGSNEVLRETLARLRAEP